LSKDKLKFILKSGDNFYPREAGKSKIQFDLSKSEQGYPCVYLGESGCSIYDNRPSVCKKYPTRPSVQRHLSRCSYIFDEKGNRSGECDGCKS
jgi:Fe-S-cluster containining protein